MLDRALKTEPGCERNAAREFFRNSRKIEHHQTKAAALQNEVGGFEDLGEAMLTTLTRLSRVVGPFDSLQADRKRPSCVVSKVKIPTLRKERGRVGHRGLAVFN